MSHNPTAAEIMGERLRAALKREGLLQQRLTAADQQIDELTRERERLIAYGRSCGLDEASTLCSRMAYDAYYPAGSHFKVFTPKAQKALGDLLIKAANKIASLPDGPYERFKARRQSRKNQLNPDRGTSALLPQNL